MVVENLHPSEWQIFFGIEGGSCREASLQLIVLVFVNKTPLRCLFYDHTRYIHCFVVFKSIFLTQLLSARYENGEKSVWSVLQHPPYNPDLAPSDFHLFGPLKQHLGGKHFEDDDDVQHCGRGSNPKNFMLLELGR
ncbi:hypothetical protein AVEN_202986-1 [Araneus ventricosus]|uniref:Tc1-like transposase DDE domain-containing protein n=1 Tax=Araneus ventricosus TaxID=182803 RepID=A0A4Y2V2G7_ARAVE|nr:hypothetical protein AVEN_109450-1 [Araneus ventricosus]GBO19419.1 hypothetical protein AVEN_202986-1 [Araneus ventricosus]